jgi:hypothetical protein
VWLLEGLLLCVGQTAGRKPVVLCIGQTAGRWLVVLCVGQTAGRRLWCCVLTRLQAGGLWCCVLARPQGGLKVRVGGLGLGAAAGDMFTCVVFFGRQLCPQVHCSHDNKDCKKLNGSHRKALIGGCEK